MTRDERQKPTTKSYRDNYEKIFSEKLTKQPESVSNTNPIPPGEAGESPSPPSSPASRLLLDNPARNRENTLSFLSQTEFFNGAA